MAGGEPCGLTIHEIHVSTSSRPHQAPSLEMSNRAVLVGWGLSRTDSPTAVVLSPLFSAETECEELSYVNSTIKTLQHLHSVAHSTASAVLMVMPLTLSSSI